MASSGHRRAWIAAPVLLGIVALGWWMLPSASAPGDTGVVRISGAAALPPVRTAPASVEPEAAPPSPQRNAALADDSHYLVLREARDLAWADRSEAAILGVLRSLAYVDRGSLAAKCTTSVCEASGIAEEDPASGSMGPIWEALDQATGGNRLSGQELERAATTFGTGRVREEFVIHYRRIAADAAPG